ncbi:hypothetical protein KP79_PYT22510 [Mizuhopecten yessoensis]|uniref:SGNH hydrolase-type esterase domain-containing protein n=1 Tax=Mizuhopecten yessoensis TaxID=6573 RepID=A0A210QLZ3_MIZYE|nr:hypothetical protein KP79_PYT22510 [Mizuhopecten yessoensis]
MKREVAAARPDIIILHLGANDISPSRRPGDIADAVISLVEEFRALGCIVRVVEFFATWQCIQSTRPDHPYVPPESPYS